MSNFNNDRNSPRKDFRDKGRDFNRGDRQMFPATCSNCGKACQVPFQPTGDKPVYCSDCFEKVRGSQNSSPRHDRPDFRPQPRFGAPSFRAPNADQNKNQFDAVNVKLDKILSLLQPKAEARVEAVAIPVETHVAPEVTTEVVEVKTPKAKKITKKALAKKK